MLLQGLVKCLEMPGHGMRIGLLGVTYAKEQRLKRCCLLIDR